MVATLSQSSDVGDKTWEVIRVDNGSISTAITPISLGIVAIQNWYGINPIPRPWMMTTGRWVLDRCGRYQKDISGASDAFSDRRESGRSGKTLKNVDLGCL